MTDILVEEQTRYPEVRRLSVFSVDGQRWASTGPIGPNRDDIRRLDRILCQPPKTPPKPPPKSPPKPPPKPKQSPRSDAAAFDAEQGGAEPGHGDLGGIDNDVYERPVDIQMAGTRYRRAAVDDVSASGRPTIYGRRQKMSVRGRVPEEEIRVEKEGAYIVVVVSKGGEGARGRDIVDDVVRRLPAY